MFPKPSEKGKGNHLPPGSVLRILALPNYPNVVNAEQLSEMLGGVSTKTVYRLLKKGEIKSKYIGKRYVIPKLYVIEYITRQQQ